MAQLPPKVPTIVSQDHHHHHQEHHQNHHDQNGQDPNDHQWLRFTDNSVALPPSHEEKNPSWVDEFIEFSATKREAQRRLTSDSSVAYIEQAGAPFPRFEAPKLGHDQFDKFDDEQFMSMFGTELRSNLSASTSDHNSTNEDQKRGGGFEEELEQRKRGENGGETGLKPEVEEVESSCELDKDGQQGKTPAGNGNANAGAGDEQQVIDPKRVKRILANRQSAQRSRVRKLQYISELERSVTALQSEVSLLTPRVAFLDHQRMILNVDNSALKAKIAALAQDKIFKDAHQEALKREIERLRQVYRQQQQNQTTTEEAFTAPSLLPPQPIHPPPPDIKENENEQQFFS